MSWEMLNTIAQISGVILLAITFGVGAFTVYSQLRVNREQKEELRTKEEQRKLEKQISDENIALANAEAAKANEGLAKANEQIAEANKQAQVAIAAAAEARAKQEELALESRTKQKELAEAQRKLVEEQTKLADAQRKQAETELALRKLLEKVSKRTQRSLTSEQREGLIRSLKTWSVRARITKSSEAAPRITILMPEVPEATTYALELNEAITAAGWDTVVVSVKSLVPPVQGIVLRHQRRNTNTSNMLFTSGSYMSMALRSAGILFAEESGAELNTLVIGYKEP